MKNKLMPLIGISNKASEALGKNRFLGAGSFSQVYQLNETQVVKFSCDLKALELLQRLGEQSSYFPKVFEIDTTPQARRADGMEYFSAVVEKLNTQTPKWAFDLVSFYISTGYPSSPTMSAIQFYQLQEKIKTNKNFVPADCAQGLAQAIGLLAKECMSNFYCGDLRADANIMTRDDGHLVIADPAHSYELFKPQSADIK